MNGKTAEADRAETTYLFFTFLHFFDDFSPFPVQLVLPLAVHVDIYVQFRRCCSVCKVEFRGNVSLE